jgi:YidC/Oxa1 family membrane protein insertase
MEKRAILAAVLMAAVFLGGQYLLFPTPPPAPPVADKPPAGAPPTETAAAKPQPAPPPAVAPASPAAPVKASEPRPEERLAKVDAPLYRAVVSSDGGKIKDLVLKYRGDKPLVMVGDLGPKGLMLGAPGGAGEVVPMRLSTEALSVTRDGPPQPLVLTGDQAGLKISETLVFHADTYTIDTKVRLQNTGTTPRAVTVSLPWETRQAWHEGKEKFQGQHPTEIAWAAGGRVYRAHDLCAVTALHDDGEWISAGSIAYIAALIPRSGDFKLVARAEDKKVCEGTGKVPVGRASIAVEASPTIGPGQAWEGAVTMYAGPKEYARLRAAGIEGAIDFGGFLIPQSWTGGQPLLPMAWLGIPILLVMNWLYHYVGNYGIAIIVLTVVSKVLFYPLTVKSMRSMKAMQELQPQINTIRNKYKSDPQRLQRETLELYRTHKVNPMGGCLPMIAQIPIFYALYIALTVSVELQNASFACFGRAPSWVPGIGGADLWICDLAQQDPTYILPLLMGVTMFVQQKLTPVTGDPRQAKMMLMMPVVFTFMFLNLASGLVLYWTVSNILQIGQQYLMNRPPARARREVRNAG